MADGIPVVGHVKGTIHYIAGDKEGGDNAMKSASRTTGVIAGGVGGFFVAGPGGAVLGGIAGGAAMDGVTTGVDSAVHKEFRPNGTIAAVKQVVKEPSPGAVFDAIAVPVFDGVAGYGAGQIAGAIKTAVTKAKVNIAQQGMVPETVTNAKVSITQKGMVPESSGPASSSSAVSGGIIDDILVDGLGRQARSSRFARAGSTIHETMPTIPNESFGGTSTLRGGNVGIPANILNVDCATSTNAVGTNLSAQSTEGIQSALNGLTVEKVVHIIGDVAGATGIILKGIATIIEASRTSSQERPNVNTANEQPRSASGENAEVPVAPVEPAFNHPAMRVNQRQTDRQFINDMIEKCAPTFKSMFDKIIRKDGITTVANRSRRYKHKVRRHFLNTLQEQGRFVESDSDDNLTDHETEKVQKISCVHWDASYLGTVHKVDMGFVIYVLFNNPEILMFNELNMNSEKILEVAQILEYTILNIPPVQGTQRGSAILFKQKTNFRFLRSTTDQTFFEDGQAGIQILSADFQFSPLPGPNSPTSPSKENYRFMSCYNRHASEESFKTFINFLEQHSSSTEQTTIYAGNLNLNKKFWADRLIEAGFADTLKLKLDTNKTGRTKTATDYVMTRKGKEEHVVSHVLTPPEGTNVHYFVKFDVAPGLKK